MLRINNRRAFQSEEFKITDDNTYQKQHKYCFLNWDMYL